MNTPETPIRPPIQPEPSSLGRKILYIAIFLILLSAIGSYLLLNALGLTAIIGTAVGIVIIATIAVFAIAVLLLFIIPGILVAIVVLFALAWVILATILFPILFPIIAPIFILLVCLALINKSSRRKIP